MRFARFARYGFVFVIVAAAGSLHAQSSVPTLTRPVPTQAFAAGGPAATIDARNHFAVPGVTGSQFAQFDTVFGRFNVELRNDVAPRHVANFLAYVQSGAYVNTFIHRAASFDNGGNGPVSIVQGGGYGYRLPFQVTTVTKLAPVTLEYNLPNARGTLAAARTGDPDSATSEWYFNTRDNSTILGQSNGGGYTVFGQVLGTGMTVVDQIAALTRFNAGANTPFTEIPLRNYTSGGVTETNLIAINSVRQATLFPATDGVSVVGLTVENSAPTVVTAALAGSTLTLTPASAGAATITLRASDSNGNTAESTFTVNVSADAPGFTFQPASQTVAAGSTVALNALATGVTSYRWERNGAEIPGGTSGTLAIANASAADAGAYVSVATTSVGEVRSVAATLTVVALAPTDVGRLINLSILTAAGSGANVLTMGATVGKGDPAGALPLVIRAVGPTLGQPPFGVAGVLRDPVMSLFAAGNPTPIDSNDNWGGGAELAAAFGAVGAFALPAASLDSAFVRTTPGVAGGGYTVQVSGKGEASGVVIAEVYDAAGAARTAATPRLINLSTLAPIAAGTDLAVGFVLGGQSARTVLVRGVGPSLVAFNVPGPMADPRLELFDSASRRIFANDDWAGSSEIAANAAAVGAFALTGPASKDATILVTLPPGAYTARIAGAAGAAGAGGTALVEVYEVP